MTGVAAVGGGSTAIVSAFGISEMIALGGVLITFTALATAIYFHRKNLSVAREALEEAKRFNQEQLKILANSVGKKDR